VHPFTSHEVACVQYPIMSGSTTIYYAIRYQVDDVTQACTMLGPTSVSGSFPYPMACPDCIHFTGDTNERPGYPGAIKTPDYDPTAVANDPVGIPRLAGAPASILPVSTNKEKIQFIGKGGTTIYAILHTIRIQPKSTCLFQGRKDCAKLPDEKYLHIGYEVVTPPESEKASYTEYNAKEPEGYHYLVSPKNAPADPETIALVILHQE
jgi:hypothetical protein